ncbi:hypothetical protein CCAX7_12080 [Capsulimonas corticalis]|uniref:Uncharacterized protein n=1 Tax=Capsulimonas corticalis TaxID=2219043 RepID=A0A402D4I8_9BACT|nr:hypothetical protein [Capsulimonas corticalis]BDI29157.1 hypothetical protein CCAX7_12080 [Capsulimonas corticalis]
MHYRVPLLRLQIGPAVFAPAVFLCFWLAAAPPARAADSPWAGSRPVYCAKTDLIVSEIGTWTLKIDKSGAVTATGEMDQQVRRPGAGAGPDQPCDFFVGHYTATGNVTAAGVIHLRATSKDARYYPNLPLIFDGAYDAETKSFHGHYYYGAKADGKTLGLWY